MAGRSSNVAAAIANGVLLITGANMPSSHAANDSMQSTQIEESAKLTPATHPAPDTPQAVP